MHLKDCSDLEFDEIKISGNSRQKKREGYNLLNYIDKIVTSKNGLTIATDKETGYITVNGTPTSNYTPITIYAIKITDKLEVGKQYTLWQEQYGTTNNQGVYLQVIKGDSNNNYTYYASQFNKITFTVQEGYTYSFALQTGLIENTGTLTNYKNRYMIYERNKRQAIRAIWSNAKYRISIRGRGLW